MSIVNVLIIEAVGVCGKKEAAEECRFSLYSNKPLKYIDAGINHRSTRLSPHKKG